MWLLIASLFFYGWWHWPYLGLLLCTSAIDFWVARCIQNTTAKARRKAWLVVSLASNLLILCYFKYGLFLGSNLAMLGITPSVPLWLHVVLPVGISFYTFQAMAYVVDVYRQRLPAERSFSDFLLFITFFPQLVAGPIERAPHLLGQLKKVSVIPSDRIVAALYLIVWGFMKKTVIADRLAVFVDETFAHPATANVLSTSLATIFFGFQIYCDFSAYSDIARGVARFFGIDLMLNFNKPYLATQLQDFWRRWHISLSGWFRDYVYIPFGGNQVGNGRTHVNLLIVFMLSGLWHGASWTFALWGLWHGVGLIGERLVWQRSTKMISRCITILWVFFGWMIFRASGFHDLVAMVRSLGNLSVVDFQSFNAFHSNTEFTLALAGIFSLMLVENYWNALRHRFLTSSNRQRQWLLLTFLFIFTVWFGQFKGQDFIYFQF